MVLKSLDERVTEMRSQFIARHVTALDETIALAESPIERALLWALVQSPYGGGYQGAYLFGKHYHCMSGVPYDAELPGLSFEGLTVFPQLKVKTSDATYRLDMGLDLAVLFADGREDRVAIDVECDGHDFHERTKEQAERDKKRDRDLQATGWRIARFTGSEIYRDPDRVAVDVFRFCVAVADQVRGGK